VYQNTNAARIDCDATSGAVLLRGAAALAHLLNAATVKPSASYAKIRIDIRV